MWLTQQGLGEQQLYAYNVTRLFLGNTDAQGNSVDDAFDVIQKETSEGDSQMQSQCFMSDICHDNTMRAPSAEHCVAWQITVGACTTVMMQLWLCGHAHISSACSMQDC